MRFLYLAPLLLACAGTVDQQFTLELRPGMSKEEVIQTMRSEPASTVRANGIEGWRYSLWDGSPFYVVFDSMGRTESWGPSTGQKQLFEIPKSD